MIYIVGTNLIQAGKIEPRPLMPYFSKIQLSTHVLPHVL